METELLTVQGIENTPTNTKGLSKERERGGLEKWTVQIVTEAVSVKNAVTLMEREKKCKYISSEERMVCFCGLEAQVELSWDSLNI